MALFLVISLLAVAPVHAGAEGEREMLNLVTGFYCLHPHRNMPSDYQPQTYTSVSVEDYEGYPEETMHMIAAAVILPPNFKEDTGNSVGNNDIQQVIWHIVCTEPSDMERQYHLDTDCRKEYYAYVMEHYTEIIGHYQMTVWVADSEDFQDMLEAKRIVKHGIPSVEKKVLDKNDTDNLGDELVGWQDSADYDIGDSIPFQVTATLRDLDGFDAYYVEFVDTMQHLTFDPSTICITVDGSDKTEDFSVDYDAENKTLTVKCEDVLSLGAVNGSQIVVTYEAVLDEDAVIGREGNPNEVYLVYSRTSKEKGTSITDKVTVFTYQVTINKIAEDGEPLTGAAFELFKKNSEGQFVSLGAVGADKTDDGYVLTDDTRTTFQWKGIDDGTYKLVEVVTPAGYNTMDPVVFTITVTHDRVNENPLINSAVSDYPGFAGSNAYQANSVKAGKFEGDIINRAGVVLPDTGGMGTTAFYWMGYALLAGAAVLLASKTRRGTIQ